MRQQISILILLLDKNNEYVLVCLLATVWQKTINSEPCLVFLGESPGCCLLDTASMLEWLRNLLSILRPQGVLNVPLYF